MIEAAQKLKAYKQWLASRHNFNLEIKQIENAIRPQLDQIAKLRSKIRELNYCTKCGNKIEHDNNLSSRGYCRCRPTGYPQE